MRGELAATGEVEAGDLRAAGRERCYGAGLGEIEHARYRQERELGRLEEVRHKLGRQPAPLEIDPWAPGRLEHLDRAADELIRLPLVLGAGRNPHDRLK